MGAALCSLRGRNAAEVGSNGAKSNANRQAAIERVEQEFILMQVKQSEGSFPEIVDVVRAGPLKIVVKVLPEDEKVLAQMKAVGVDSITLEAVYPENYPSAPLLLRVVSPQFQQYTGFVSVNGAVLMECLSPGQGLTKWSDQMTLDFAILTWLTEASRVKSAEFDTIDNGKQTGGVLTVASAAASCYTESSAREDFKRCVAANNWY